MQFPEPQYPIQALIKSSWGLVKPWPYSASPPPDTMLTLKFAGKIDFRDCLKNWVSGNIVHSAQAAFLRQIENRPRSA